MFDKVTVIGLVENTISFHMAYTKNEVHLFYFDVKKFRTGTGTAQDDFTISATHMTYTFFGSILLNQ